MKGKQNFIVKNDKVTYILSILVFIFFSFIIIYTDYFGSITCVDYFLMVGFLSPAFIFNEIFYNHQIHGNSSIKSKAFLKIIDSVKGFGLIFPFLFLFIMYKYFQIHGIVPTILLLIISSISLQFYFQYLRRVIRNEYILLFLFAVPFILFIRFSI